MYIPSQVAYQIWIYRSSCQHLTLVACTMVVVGADYMTSCILLIRRLQRPATCAVYEMRKAFNVINNYKVIINIKFLFFINTIVYIWDRTSTGTIVPCYESYHVTWYESYQGPGTWVLYSTTSYVLLYIPRYNLHCRSRAVMSHVSSGSVTADCPVQNHR